MKKGQGGREWRSVERMTSRDASRVLGIARNELYAGIESGDIPVGYVSKDTDKRAKYYIYKAKVATFMGISRDDLERALAVSGLNNKNK